MKINRLILKNYRCFEKFEITFQACRLENDENANLHVLIAPNMTGKSAILKALRIAIGTSLQKIRANPGLPNTLNISSEEHRVIGTNPFSDKAREVEIEVYAEAPKWDGKNWISTKYNWKKYKEDYTGKHTKVDHKVGNIVIDANSAFNKVIEYKEGVIPLLLYVGTEYIHQQKAVTDSLDQDGSAKQGYWYCLDDKSMEAYVFEWFKKLHKTRLEQERSSLAKELYESIAEATLTTFKNAIKTILPDILDVDWVENTTGKNGNYFLVFNIKHQGVRTYEMLSDGYKYLVLLIGELVTRATLLNKHLGNDVLSNVNGIVLIDEFGIHLHPNLQADSLIRLSKLFSQIQFIITTHSPLLINGLKKEQIHILSEDEDGKRIVVHPLEDAIGLGAEGILREMFGLNSTFDEKSIQQNEEYKALLQKKNESSLEDTEENRFRELGTKLASFRLDPMLTIVHDDPITQAVKERMEKEANNSTSVFTKEDAHDMKNKVNSILDEMFNAK